MSEIATLQKNIQSALSDKVTATLVFDDWAKTFRNIGLSDAAAQDLTSYIMQELLGDGSLPQKEKRIFQMLCLTPTSENDSRFITTVLDKKMQGRAKTIFNQIAPHLQNIHGKVLDFGAGDGQVTQLLHDRLNLDISGVDVRDYRASGVTVPLILYDGRNIDAPDGFCEVAIATNVFHHATKNERCLSELFRVVSRSLVVIETVPAGNTPEAIQKDRARTFMSDYLYNRLLHNPKFNVPVPGTYETPERWIARHEKLGWKTSHSQNLGEDIEVIADTHHLLVFDK